MSYIRRKGRGMMGFGDDCSSLPSCSNVPAGTACQLSDGSFVFAPQCGAGASAATPASSGSGGGLIDLAKSLVSGATDILKAKVSGPQSTTIVQGGGMDMTKVALVGAGVVGLVLLLRRRKSA